jgi:hypothetical protein
MTLQGLGSMNKQASSVLVEAVLVRALDGDGALLLHHSISIQPEVLFGTFSATSLNSWRT